MAEAEKVQKPPKPEKIAQAEKEKPEKEKHEKEEPQPILLQPGQVVEGHEIIKPLGKGKFSIVYMVKRLSDSLLCALKKINIFDMMQPKQREKCLKEVRLLQSLDHPNIVKLLEAITGPSELLIIVDWAEKGDLKRLIRKAQQAETHFEEPHIWQYSAQLSGALEHMHGKRIMHRDLKPANIFVAQDGSLKLGDLGLGRSLSLETMEAFSKVGTPLYMSPEVLHGAGYDMKSDVWSLGCVLYEIAMLRSPFKSDQQLSLYDLFVRISKGQYPPLTDILSVEFRGLVTHMLALEAAKRPDSSTVLAACQAHLASLAVAADVAGGASATGAAAAQSSASSAALGQAKEEPQRLPSRPSPLLLMEDIVEKLKLLDCEERLLRPRGYPLLHRCFFTQRVPLPGELTQFEVMFELCRWVLSFQKAREERAAREEAQGCATAATGSSLASSGQADASAGPCLVSARSLPAHAHVPKAPCGRRRPGPVATPPPAGASMGAGDAAAGGLGSASGIKPHPPTCSRPPSRLRVRAEDAFDLTESLVAELEGRGISITSESTKGQLRNGFGEGVCIILNELINRELLARDFHFDCPDWEQAECSQQVTEEVDEELEVEPASPGSAQERGLLESTGGEAEEEESLEEEPPFGLDRTAPREPLFEPVCTAQAVDVETWRAEVQRVAPSLQFQVREDASDSVGGWRPAFDAARQLCRSVLDLRPSTEVVELLHYWQAGHREDVARVRGHEDRLNTALAPSREELGNLAAAAAQEAERLGTLHSRVDELSHQLAAVSQELEKAQEQAAAHCEALSDAEKLAQLRASLRRLKEEDRQLAVRAAILQSDLLHRRELWRAEEAATSAR